MVWLSVDGTKEDSQTKSWRSLFPETVNRLQVAIQEFPFIPLERRSYEQNKIRADFYQLEELGKRLYGTEGAQARQNEIIRLKALMSLYMTAEAQPLHATSHNNNHSHHHQMATSHDDAECSRPLPQADYMRRTDDRLVEIQRLAAESEQIGSATMNQLKMQGEQLQRARNQLYQTDRDLDTSNRLMTQIMRRARANKMITYALMALLVLAILIVVYSKIFK